MHGIAPGLIKPPLNAAWIDAQATDLPRHYEKKILLGRIGTPEDCAGAVTFLCSPAGATSPASGLTAVQNAKLSQLDRTKRIRAARS